MTDIHTCSYHCERPACIKAQRDALRDKHFAAHDLLTASQALVDRWDTPLWKDAMHTAIFIEVLRDAVQKYRAREV
jgi:hypothetical protein